MKIQEEDFILESIDDSSPFFDLELLHTIRPKGKEPRQEFKNSGYGLPIESAIKRIAQYRINNKHKDEAITLQTYFKEFKEEIEKLLTICDPIK